MELFETPIRTYLELYQKLDMTVFYNNDTDGTGYMGS